MRQSKIPLQDQREKINTNSFSLKELQKKALTPKTNGQKPKNIEPTFVFETHANICDSERKNVYS